jgi:hypothetical protein
MKKEDLNASLGATPWVPMGNPQPHAPFHCLFRKLIAEHR